MNKGKQILKATRQRSKSRKETDQQYRERVLQAVDKLSNIAFDKLSAKAQKWFNAAASVFNNRKNIRDFPKAVEKELLKATRQRSKSRNESDQQYRERVMWAVNKLSDGTKLSPKAKRWFNSAVSVFNKRKNIRDFPKAPKSLVQKHLENIDSEVLEEAPEIISELVDGQNGIYALYSGDKLYYVGLAKSLLSRLLGHLVDRHEGKWDRFSVYLTGPEHRKDLETLLIHIAGPHLEGCKNRGNFVVSNNLSREVKASFKELILRKKKKWLGE